MKTIEHEGRSWMTVADAAELAGVQAVTIYKSIERGRLSSTRLLDALVVVPEDEVAKLWPEKAAEAQ